MYNPSRGGVRGGADQFTWESVKSDKHRENYLGHSLMAPVGRWQKGKDLAWYSKERKDVEEQKKFEKMELASIKRAEEEAMLIALGHNITRKETQKLSKEEIQEALKRNTVARDVCNIERVDGVGASGSSKRLALLSNAGSNFKQKQEGVAFEGYKDKRADTSNKSDKRDDTYEKRKKSKKSKKQKKEKKHKKHHKESSDCDSSEPVSKRIVKHKKSDSDSDGRKSPSKHKNHKKSMHRHRDYSTNDLEKHHSNHGNGSLKRHEKHSDYSNVKRHRHDSSGSD